MAIAFLKFELHQYIKSGEMLAYCCCAQTHNHSLQQCSTLSTQRLFDVIEQLKYTSCQAVCLMKSFEKLAAGRLTTICETSILSEAVQFLLIACKRRQQNLKNECPHAEISPTTSRGHTPVLLQSDYFKCFSLKFQNHQKDITLPECDRMNE